MEYAPAKVTIDLAEYEKMKKTIAEAKDLLMHREAIADIINAISSIGGDRLVMQVLAATRERLTKHKGIELSLTRYASGGGDGYLEKGVHINRLKP